MISTSLFEIFFTPSELHAIPTLGDDPETFETNVPGLFVAGGAIAGVDTGTIFIENGRFHGTKIVEEIARRLQS